jgi:pimeloyl-ACP methyl ester carboxylesterase
MPDLLTELRRVDPRADLARTRCPVWLVNGQLDHFRLQERAFAAAAPDARVVTIRGATHLANLVRPVAFTRVLLEALDEVDRRDADRGEQARGEGDRQVADRGEAG